ncbi:hypothetical protein ED733_006057 [Metarhizium rileyi]|uniref:Protein kinase domain-containing protein n=1 Tax=Metarhizium rileyi (strain RCEF 4871) TaxID=1649241 RepID=A0A5C6GJB2_METRR|nr:hypothetical protein ED733_006057 [Metarhizium rileyi]
MSDSDVVEYHHYHPHGVRRVLASGTSAFIGEVDSLTILKYPLKQGGDSTRLELEHKILDIVGHHPHVIAQKGFTEAGLYLERATNGTIFQFLTETKRRDISLQQRIAWCREVAEAIEHVHSKRVIHCDIQPTNILLDQNLHIKLADFQGQYLSENGEVILSGWSGEPCRYFCPREDEFEADLYTDLFAFGSTIYFIMTDHEVFSDIVAGQPGWDEKVKLRFQSSIFPNDAHILAAITQKCWTRQYGSATEVLEDIKAIECARALLLTNPSLPLFCNFYCASRFATQKSLFGCKFSSFNTTIWAEMANSAKRILVSVSSKSPYWSEAWESSLQVIKAALGLLEESKLICSDGNEHAKPRFLVKERWNVRTFIVFDMFYDTYDPNTAHLPSQNNLPVNSVFLGEKISMSVASNLVENEVNRRVQEIHDATGIGSRPPFSVDHMSGNMPCYTNSRTR